MELGLAVVASGFGLSVAPGLPDWRSEISVTERQRKCFTDKYKKIFIESDAHSHHDYSCFKVRAEPEKYSHLICLSGRLHKPH